MGHHIRTASNHEYSIRDHPQNEGVAGRTGTHAARAKLVRRY